MDMITKSVIFNFLNVDSFNSQWLPSPHHLYLNFHSLKKSDICLNISNSTAMNYLGSVILLRLHSSAVC